MAPAAVSVDLAKASVFLDFDGTISTRDVSVHVLERLADPSWHEIETMYERGELGSREAMVAQFSMLPPDEAAVRSAAAEVGLDPDVGPLIDELRAAGAQVTVVSDGFGFYVHDAMAPFGVPVLTNAVDFDSFELSFPHEDACCACASCGTCKQAPIRAAQRAGRTAIFVGDGLSDRKAALLADVLFAKDALAAWCAAFDTPHVAWATLADVRAALVGR